MSHPVQNFPMSKAQSKTKKLQRVIFYQKGHFFINPRIEWYRLNWRRVGKSGII